MGSNAIIIAGILFLLLSAVVMILMVRTMMKKEKRVIVAVKAIHMPDYDDSEDLSDDDDDSTIDLFEDLSDAQKLTEANGTILYHGNIYFIDSFLYEIGRSDECNLVIADGSVSRHHCEIYYHDSGTFILSDLQTSNGTYVNGQRIIKSVELHNEDEIRIGRVVMKFRCRNERKTDNSDTETPS